MTRLALAALAALWAALRQMGIGTARRAHGCGQLLRRCAALQPPGTDTPANIPEPSMNVVALPALLAVARKPGKAVRKSGKSAPPGPINDLQANLLMFSQVLDAEIKEPASNKVRRIRRSMKSAEDHTAVAKERVKKFLAQPKRRAKTRRR